MTRSGNGARSTAALMALATVWVCAAGRSLPAQSPVPADSARAAQHWQIAAEFRAGAPTGYVQVRENTVQGTRLPFGSGLNVHAIWAADLELDYAPDPRTRLSLTITNFGLSGTTTLAQDTYFNGTTLQGGTALNTDTNFPDYIAFTITGERRIAQLGSGELSGTAGLSFVALTFVLHGTLAPSSATRETQEDFVTQELPVPELGVAYRAPLGSRARLELKLTGGWLPWVNSLRKEGGTVTVTQTAAQLEAGVRYDLTAALGLTGAVRLSSFNQDEQSTEDGNVISMRTATLGIGLAQRF
jgi:hypothetical protein